MNDSQESPPKLSVVVPVYRSEGSLETLVHGIFQAFAAHPSSVEIILVNDCSPDSSWDVIKTLTVKHPAVKGIDLRRNFGQDNAIMTGLRAASGEFCAVMDDDLQHDPADLPRLLEDIQKGSDVTYGSYHDKKQRWWKNIGSWLNGKTAEWLLGKPKGIYLSPYKILRREIVDAICDYDGPYPYVDGLLFQITSSFSEIPVQHHARPVGTGNYNLASSIGVWLRLSSQFSVRPLRLVTLSGFAFGAVGAAAVLALVYYRLTQPEQFFGAVAGWASLMATILVLGGIQMVFLGVMGEYIGRTYLKVNRKPQSLIRESVNLAG